MYNIGQKIKELRRKNDLTQEKLADSLGVSYQAVSKWETGVSSPDLSLIVPLARMFGVTTDELLGNTTEDANDLREQYDTAYRESPNNDDHQANYWMARQAVIDFPDDFRYLEWLATSEYYLAFDENKKPVASVEYFNELMNNSLRRFEYIIEHCREPQICRKAVLGKIVDLRFLDRIIEAEWSAQFEYPDEKITSVDDALNLCKEGRELLAYLEEETLTQMK